MTLTYRYFTVKKWAILIVTIVLSIRLGHWSDGMDAVKRLGGHVRTNQDVRMCPVPLPLRRVVFTKLRRAPLVKDHDD